MLILTLILAGTAAAATLFFKDRHIGIAAILLGVIMIPTVIALGLQTFGLFTRSFMTGVCLLVLFAVWYGLVRYRTRLHVPHRVSWAISAMVLLALGIVGYQFYAVHFSYTGIANTLLYETYVAESAYPYPLFSDEWIAVAVADAAINAQSLPFVHPFTGGTYQNFLFIFHSFIAGVGVLFGGSLATMYVWIGIVISTLTAAALFIFWRSVGIAVGVAVLGVLLVPYVVGGSNLPMLWYLLPWNVGFLLMLVAFTFFARKRLGLALTALASSVSMYPPFVVFAIPIVVGTMLQYSRQIQKRVFAALALFLIGAPAAFIAGTAMWTDLSVWASLSRFIEVLIRPLNSAFGSVPMFLPWHVLPFFVLPFVAYGCFVAHRELRYVVLPAMLGMLIWLLNPLTDTTFFIDYHRVVAVTALLMLALGMSGMHSLWVLLVERFTLLKRYAVAPLLMAALLMTFLLLVPGYTARDGWRHFTTTYYDPLQGFIVEAAPAPVNRYVQPDDLEIFSTISGERFLAPGWKGLVLGTLTNNDPVFTKPSTITMKTVGYVAFLQASCEEKHTMLRAARVGYVYAEKVNCPGFESLAVSKEGLHLLRVVSQ